MRYYDIGRHWTKHIAPHLSNPVVQARLIEDFNKFTFGRWGQDFTAGMTPHQFETCDWWIFHHGPMPRYWQYVKHSACHWLVNFNLVLAQFAVPDATWRIVTSDKHSTTWDGKDRLFDLNFLALDIAPDECFAVASQQPSKVLLPGEFIEVYYADHCSVDAQARTA